METHESLLSVFFEKEFREMQESNQANWLQDCARMVSRMVLRGSDEAIWAAKIRLGQCQTPEE